MTTKTNVIVIAWTAMDGMAETGKMVRFDGYNYRPETIAARQAHATMWLNRGTATDVAKAEAYAQTLRAEYDTVRVFTFSGERDPLGVAKRQILAAKGA